MGLMGLSKNGGRWTQHNIRRLPKLEQLCQRDHPKVDATRSPRKLTCPKLPKLPKLNSNFQWENDDNDVG